MSDEGLSDRTTGRLANLTIDGGGDRGSYKEQSETRPAEPEQDVVFIGTDPQDLIVHDGLLSGVRFENCVINELVLHNCMLVGVTFKDCYFQRTRLDTIFMMAVQAEDCLFEDLIWMNDRWDGQKKGLSYADETVLGETVPQEIADPDWLRAQDLEAHHLRVQQPQWPVPDTDWNKDDHSQSVPDWTPSSVQYPVHDNWPVSESYLNIFEPPVEPTPKKATVVTKPRERFKKWESIHDAAMSHEARLVARSGQFPFLHLEEKFRSQVYEALLEAPGLRIADVPEGYKGPEITDHQLRYTLVDKLGGGRQRIYRTTYIAGTKRDDRKTMGIDTSILYASKQLWQEGAKVLYGQLIYFSGTAEGALSWLHGASRYLHFVKKLVFIYRSQETKLQLGPRLGLVTFKKSSKDAFRRLCNAIVHKCEGLSYFGLILDDKFWATHKFRKGAEQVLESHSYLQHVARLAQYDRTSAQTKAGNNGVHLQLHVERTDTYAKEQFIAELEHLIQRKRDDRPKIAMRRECHGCKAKCYEDCCFVKLPEDELTGRGASTKA